MSVAPKPPGRFDAKYKLSPSGDSSGARSANRELTTGPRLTGVDHSEKWSAPIETSSASTGPDGGSASGPMSQAPVSAQAAPQTSRCITLMVPPQVCLAVDAIIEAPACRS